MVRPRLYEPKPETLTAPLLDVLKAIDVVYVQGSAETIDTKRAWWTSSPRRARRTTLSYDRLVVATGSRLFRPNIPGLAEHGFSVDSLDDAIALDQHLHSLADRPAIERARHGRRGRRRVHRHRGGDRNAGAASRHSRQGCQAARHHRRAQQRDRPRYGRRPPPRHRGRAAQARRGDPARCRRRLTRQIRRHA